MLTLYDQTYIYVYVLYIYSHFCIHIDITACGNEVCRQHNKLNHRQHSLLKQDLLLKCSTMCQRCAQRPVLSKVVKLTVDRGLNGPRTALSKFCVLSTTQTTCWHELILDLDHCWYLRSSVSVSVYKVIELSVTVRVKNPTEAFTSQSQQGQ